MSKIKSKMIRLKLSPRSEYFRLVSFDLLFFVGAILLFYFVKEWMYSAFLIGFACLFTYMYLSRYTSMIEKMNKASLVEFVNLFNFFKVYIHNGFNVYSSLKEITNFAEPNLREMLEDLLKNIDRDKTVRPFIQFSKNFDEILIEEMMISIYQMIDDGEQSNYLTQFELIFDKFAETIAENDLRAKDASLGLLSSAPLVGSCFLIIIITVGIITVIGELINVI